MTYTCPASHKSKAAAREAVAALSIEEGLVEYLKDRSQSARSSGVTRSIEQPKGTIPSAKSNSGHGMDVEQANVQAVGERNSSRTRPSYTQQLLGRLCRVRSRASQYS